MSADVENPNEQPSRSVGLILSWRVIAIINATIAVASLAALAVIASVKSSDTLATIALALAVATFMVQTVMFVGQFAVMAEQISRADTIYNETRGILSRIESQSQATQVIVTQHYDKLLNRVIAGTNATFEAAVAAGPEIDVDDLKQQIVTDIVQIVSAERSAAIGQPVPIESRITDPVVMLKQWPADKVLQTLASDGLGNLSASGQTALAQIASQYLASFGRDSAYVQWIPKPEDPGMQELARLGVIQQSSVDQLGIHSARYKLTHRGRIAVRLMLAELPVSEEASRLFPWLSGRRTTSVSGAPATSSAATEVHQ